MIKVKKTINFYLSEIDTPLEDVKIKLSSFGLQGKDSTHSHGPTTKNEHVIQYIFSGEGSFIIGNKIYKLKQNDLFYLPKNEIVKYFSSQINPYSYYWIGFDGDSATTILNAMGLSKDFPVVHIEDNGITDTFENLKIAIFKNGLQGNLEVNSNILKLFSLLIKEDTSNKKSIKNVSIEYVNKAIYFIRENFGKDINVTKISEVIGLNRNYFDAIFKERMGISPIEYLINYRIEQAKIMLLLGMSVTEVAINCGFNSPSNFGAKFKKITGITPLSYKKKFKKINA